MNIAVIGYGVVGKHMTADIERAGHTAVVHDVATIARHNATHAEVNACAAAFVCVSTPPAADGSCDTGAIDAVFAWLRVPVAIIRSTVPPGTTRALADADDAREVAFVPEFIGEGVNAPYLAMRQPPFIIIGGYLSAGKAAAAVLAQLYNAECEFIYVDSTTAEVAKYGENYFLALKVSWANELYDICTKTGANFGEMMAALTHDYRIGKSHTHVYPDNRGWGGRCLPKDTAALLALVGCETAPLLAAVIAVNDKHRGQHE